MKEWPTQRGVVCDPSLDGVTHINVYSRAKTELGVALTNMSNHGINIPEIGYFCNLEGYWWWRSTGCMYPVFKTLNAFEARKKGKTLKRVPTDDFEEKIKEALTIKVRSSKWIQDELHNPNNALPLTHYYVYGNYPDCVVRPANGSLWIIDHLEELRSNGSVSELRRLE